MNHKILKLLEQLDEQLYTNNTETDELLDIEERAFNIAINILGELNQLILGYIFKTPEEEIDFFKHQKPQFMSRLILHHGIYLIELHKPLGGDSLMRIYLNKELVKLKSHFDENLDFYKYLRSDSVYLDDVYFLRGKPNIKLCHDLTSFENDTHFCTSHDFAVAATIAHSQIEAYINLSLNNLDNKSIAINSPLPINPTWKSSKTSLIELIYALHYQGAIENSKSGLKGLILFFESAFNIKLGNHYVTFSEIKERKNGISKFLDSLKETFVRKVEDENNK